MNLHLDQQMTDLGVSVTTLSICLPANTVVVPHCWGWISHEGVGMRHYIGHLDGLQYKHVLQNVMVPSMRMLYPDGIIHFQLEHSSIIFVVWFKNGCPCRPTSNSVTGHRERLIWTTTRICGVRWRGQYRKPGLSSLPGIVMSCGPWSQTRGMKLLHFSVTFDHWLSPWRDGWNQWSKHRGSGLLIKEARFWNSHLRKKC
jgi:hypothetical protein